MHERASNYHLAQGVRARQFGDELVLLDVERDLSYSLNSTAALLVAWLQAGDPVEEVVRRIAGHYAIDVDTARQDVDRIVVQLCTEQLLVRS